MLLEEGKRRVVVKERILVGVICEILANVLYLVPEFVWGPLGCLAWTEKYTPNSCPPKLSCRFSMVSYVNGQTFGMTRKKSGATLIISRILFLAHFSMGVYHFLRA